MPIFLVLLVCSIPSRRRIRFDRQRGIIYTFYKGKLHVTEINKLMRPLSEYIQLDIHGVHMWVHPYAYPTGKERMVAWPGYMTFSDTSMWRHLFNHCFEDSGAFFMQEVLVEFMNPDTPQERINELMQAIAVKPAKITFLKTWLEMGLYCKRLPAQSILEAELDNYFTHIAPTIRALPSWYYEHESEMRVWQKGMFKIVSVEENRAAGFDVPYKNLFEIPDESMHKDSFLSIESYRPLYYELHHQDDNDE